GRIRLDAIAAAYYEDAKPEKCRAVLQLEGLALDGRRRIIETLRDATQDKVQVQTDRGARPGNPVRVSGPELPFALGLINDGRAFLACCPDRDSKGPQHLRVLEQVPFFAEANAPGAAPNLLSGYLPPWLKKALAEVPPDACALVLGEIPRAWRKLLTEALELRACPRTFVFSLKREGDGVALSLALNLEAAGA